MQSYSGQERWDWTILTKGKEGKYAASRAYRAVRGRAGMRQKVE
jgi:hypothetical protein